MLNWAQFSDVLHSVLATVYCKTLLLCWSLLPILDPSVLEPLSAARLHCICCLGCREHAGEGCLSWHGWDELLLLHVEELFSLQAFTSLWPFSVFSGLWISCLLLPVWPNNINLCDTKGWRGTFKSHVMWPCTDLLMPPFLL